jgi:hypothetical protein
MLLMIVMMMIVIKTIIFQRNHTLKEKNFKKIRKAEFS